MLREPAVSESSPAFMLALKLFCCFVVVSAVHHVGAVEDANLPTERIRWSPLGTVNKVRSATKITDFCFVLFSRGTHNDFNARRQIPVVLVCFLFHVVCHVCQLSVYIHRTYTYTCVCVWGGGFCGRKFFVFLL